MSWLWLAVAVNAVATLLTLIAVIVLWRGKLWNCRSRWSKPARITFDVIRAGLTARERTVTGFQGSLRGGS